jgi:glycogen synthase
LKILVVTNLFPPLSIGGYEAMCAAVTKGLEHRGHRVDVLTTSYLMPHEVPNQANVFRVLVPINLWPGYPNGYWPHTPFDLLWWAYRNVRVCTRLVETGGYDLVYLWKMGGLPFAFVRWLQDRDIKVVMSIHDRWLLERPAYSMDPWLRLWRKKIPMPLQDPVMTIARRIMGASLPIDPPVLEDFDCHFPSHDLARAHEAAGWDLNRCAVIYNGVDLARFVGNARDFRRRPVRALFAGRLHPEKGVAMAVGAVARMCSENCDPPITLTVVGLAQDEEFNRTLQHKATSAGRSITFRDAVGADDMPRLYAEHDVLLFPSTVLEGFPLTVVEAQASGMLVVGTATGGSGEALVDGETGLLVAPGSEHDIVARLQWVLQNPERAASIASNGQRFAQNHFGVDRMVEETEAFLVSSVGRGVPIE